MSKSIKDMSVEEIIIGMEKSELHSEFKKLRDCIGIIIIFDYKAKVKAAIQKIGIINDNEPMYFDPDYYLGYGDALKALSEELGLDIPISDKQRKEA